MSLLVEHWLSKWIACSHRGARSNLWLLALSVGLGFTMFINLVPSTKNSCGLRLAVQRPIIAMVKDMVPTRPCQYWCRQARLGVLWSMTSLSRKLRPPIVAKPTGAVHLVAVKAQRSNSGALFLDSIEGYPHKSYQYILTVAYDGTEFKGWQLQLGTETIQGELEKALCKVLKLRQELARHFKMTSAGRTDSGVHAMGQIASFYCARPLNGASLVRALNSVLPSSIRVSNARLVPPDFHPKVNCVSKTYLYKVYNSKVMSPFLRHHSMLVPYGLHVQRMREAAIKMQGEHNFTHFSSFPKNSDAGRRRGPKIKTIQRINISQVGDMMEIRVQAKGFLYHQVRHMVAALLAIGDGRLKESELLRLLEGEMVSRGPQWKLADAKGLYLESVQLTNLPEDPSSFVRPDLLHNEYGWALNPNFDQRDFDYGEKGWMELENCTGAACSESLSSGSNITSKLAEPIQKSFE